MPNTYHFWSRRLVTASSRYVCDVLYWHRFVIYIAYHFDYIICIPLRLYNLRCGQDRCAESLYQWGVIASPACPCGESHQTTRHIVEECLLNAFPGGLRRLHAVEWLSKLSMKLWECSKRPTATLNVYIFLHRFLFFIAWKYCDLTTHYWVK